MKFENFWYYHKFKVLGAIIVVCVIVITVMTARGHAKPDVEIAYVTDGRIVSDDVINYMNQYFAPGIQDVNGDNKKVTAITPLEGPRIEMEFYIEGSQIILMDGGTLYKFIGAGVFKPLDDYIEKYGIDLSKYPDISTKTEWDDTIHTYAIPMECIPTLLDVGFPSENYFLTVRAIENKNTSVQEKQKNAASIVDLLLQ